MQLDLRRDFADVYDHLADRVRNFKPGGSDVLGKGKAVRIIEVGYEYAQSGWLVVVFDTRRNAESDGEWTSCIDGNELERPHWFEAGECEKPITLIHLDGTETKFPVDAEPAEPLGEMIKAVLLKARDDGVFASLPKADGCELGIENFDGGYGWPDYEDRGRENFVDPA